MVSIGQSKMKKRFKIIPLFYLLIIQQVQGQQTLSQRIEAEGRVVVAHRASPYPGFSENSLSAMSASAEAGIWLQEIDLAESKDGKLFLLHDSTLDRTTAYKGPISHYQSSQLKEIILSGTNEKLPEFEAALQHAKSLGISLMLDVKQAPLTNVMKEVQEQGMLQHVILLTFSRERAKEAMDLNLPLVVSVLINGEDDLQYYQTTGAAHSLVAYISQKAPVNLFQIVRNSGLPILTDVLREVDSTAGLLGSEHYTAFLSVRKPDIVVTDYPLKLLPIMINSLQLP
jgi:glycerophosphoryl diester phosphodiesterase